VTRTEKRASERASVFVDEKASFYEHTERHKSDCSSSSTLASDELSPFSSAIKISYLAKERGLPRLYFSVLGVR